MSKKVRVIRRLDPLGRIVLPKKYRKALDIDIKDDIEIVVEGTNVYVSKYNPGCVFCGNNQDIILFKDKPVCPECYQNIKEKNFF
ncbi:MAG: AbrB/MazE/SpoVT family DNA-binding domain-containing protein [Clostridiales bacterium]|nr:AbrB/MazE/SpoVT family DNA-binding domain-containing protein [Clostridiales bacterium]